MELPGPVAEGDAAERFAWHPRYRGQTAAAVRDELAREIAHDQRVYALALEAADEHENASLASVLELERKWGVFDLGWAETDPAALAERIVAFEWERERRRELVPYAAWRPRDEGEAEREAGSHPWWRRWLGGG